MAARQSAAVDRALRLIDRGMTAYAAAKKTGIALSTIYRAQARARKEAQHAELVERIQRRMQWARDNPDWDVNPEEIAEVRESSGMSQAQAADVIGCTPDEWAAYESGECQMSMKWWKRWQRLAMLFELRMDDPDDDTKGEK